MSNATIHQSYVDEFRDVVRHLAQQEYSRLRPFCDSDSFEAETGAWDRLSSGESDTKTRKMITPETGREWSRRIAIATPFNDAEITEVEDPSMMLIDPNSEIVRSLGMSMGRRIDDVLIEAARGNATESTRGSPYSGVTPTPVPLPPSQIVGDGTAPISFDLVTAVQEKFLENDIDLSIPKVAVVGPTQVRKLMQLTEQTSYDYVRRKLDELSETGIVPNWMGFTWIMSTRLLAPQVDQLDCLFYTNRALGLHVPQDVTTFVERDPSLSYAWRPYAQITLGAVRVEDEHMVVMRVADTL